MPHLPRSLCKVPHASPPYFTALKGQEHLLFLKNEVIRWRHLAPSGDLDSLVLLGSTFTYLLGLIYLAGFWAPLRLQVSGNLFPR